MKLKAKSIFETSVWPQLQIQAKALSDISILSLFAQERERFARLSCEHQGILLDLSKNLLPQTVLHQLQSAAHEVGLEQKIKAQFAGELVNDTEKRAALHTALRLPPGMSNPVADQVQTERRRLCKIVDDVHAGIRKGFDGTRFSDVINLGIGGSDLGPRLGCEALASYQQNNLHVHFVSNVDPQALDPLLLKLRPSSTLIVIASKSFRTQETLHNARRLKAWLDASAAGAAHGNHWIAATADPRAAQEFGIPAPNILRVWDWVGGRFSLWSAIGCSLALHIGMVNFERMLMGAHAMDAHFCAAPWDENLPVLLALAGIWNTNLLGLHSQLIIPYDQRLRLLPAYLQQLIMESNGKTVTKSGETVAGHTGPITWGGVGTDVQHSFFQLLHQGSQAVWADFLLPCNTDSEDRDGQDLLVTSGLAQMQAMLIGRDRELTRAAGHMEAHLAHASFAGNRPSTAILYPQLTPETLGALLALYEHRVMVQAALWDINPYDQFGVELGKLVTKALQSAINSGQLSDAATDPSTEGLLNYYLQHRDNMGEQ